MRYRFKISRSPFLRVYVAEGIDLVRCFSTAETRTELISNIEAAMQDYIGRDMLFDSFEEENDIWIVTARLLSIRKT